MNEYLITNNDIVAINRLIDLGGEMASIARDSVNFEVGILSKDGYMPQAYGSGDTIADAINEAIGKPSGVMADVSALQERAIDWLHRNNVALVVFGKR